MAYVDEDISRVRELARGASFQLTFGPPSGGVVEVKVRGVKDWLVEFPDPTFNPAWVLIELLDGAKRAVARGEGAVSYTMPAPPVADAGPVNPGPDWTVRITNNGNRTEKIRTDVSFVGYRPLLAKEVPFRLLNEKLGLVFTDPPPVKVVVENRIAQWRRNVPGAGLQIRTEPPPAGDTGWIAVTHTFARFDLNRDVQLVYGDVEDVDFGKKVLAEGTIETQDISVRATIHDGQLALKARVKFKSNGARYHVNNAPDIGIKSGTVDVYLVLDADRGHPSFRPMVDAQVAGSMTGIDDTYIRYAVRGAVEYLLEEKLPKLMMGSGANRMRALDRLAQVTMTFILGDRNRRLINRRYNLEIRYAGDEVGPIVATDEQPQPPMAQGKLSAIKNIVVLMMENRSFDHMLGHLTLAGRADVDGLRLDMSNPLGLTARERKAVFRLATTVGIHDPGHSFDSTKRQRGGIKIDIPILPDIEVPRNGGFIIDYEGRLQRGGLAAAEIAQRKGDVMGYYSATELPIYAQLAEDFTICDRWFAAHPGHTWPNRFISITGRLAPGPDGRPQLDNPDLTTFDPLDVRSIFDHLDAARLDWRYFEHDLCFLRLFERYTEDRRIVGIDDPAQGFWAMARAGTLPPVTYIEPSLTDLPPGNDDHPPSDVRAGQNLVGRIYNALRSGPQWKDTLFIITYDEHGGFFDHVYAPDGAAVPLCHDPDTGQPVTHYGMRVPALVISPHARRRFTSKEVYDHTTILKTIIQTFLHARPPDMGPRVAAARSLESLIDVPVLDRRPVALDKVAAAAAAPEQLPTLKRTPGDFHELMTHLAVRRKRVAPTGVVIGELKLPLGFGR